MNSAADLAATVAAKVRWRLAAPTILFMLLSALDRVNISFAALQMNRELGLTPEQYGFGAGIVFVGFLAGQYPSVLLLQRYAMHRWLAACALLWGCAALTLAFIHSAREFYLLRVLLGIAEAGLAPGIVLYLSQFATAAARASTFAVPMLAIPLSIVLGSPLSGWLMQQHFPSGLASWRWMLIAEAAPAIAAGLLAGCYFPDSPAEAAWLTPEERSWLQAHAAHRGRAAGANDWSVLRRPLVWASGALWFCLLSGSYGIMFWLPQMIKQLAGLTPLQIGWINALPWLGTMLGTYFNSAHSDRSGERFWHIALPAAATAGALLAAWRCGPGVAGLLALLVAGVGLGAATGAFWALPTTLLAGRALAVGAVAINIMGTTGGLVTPHLIGYTLQRTGHLGGATLLIVAVLMIAALLVLSIRAAAGNGTEVRGSEPTL